MRLQVAGVCIQRDAWSNVVCEYDTDTHLLHRVATCDLRACRLLMHPGAEYMVFELQPPAHVTDWASLATPPALPPHITCLLVTPPCVVLHVSLKALTVAELQAACSARPPVQPPKRHQLYLTGMASLQWMLQPKQPRDWNEKKTGVRKAACTPKKRRVRVQEEVQEEEEDDDVLDDAVDDGDEGEEDDDAEEAEGEVNGEEDDEAEVEVEDGGDEADCDDAELEDEEEGELDEEVDDAVSANSSEDEEQAGSKRAVKKARRG